MIILHIRANAIEVLISCIGSFCGPYVLGPRWYPDFVFIHTGRTRRRLRNTANRLLVLIVKTQSWIIRGSGPVRQIYDEVSKVFGADIDKLTCKRCVKA